MDVVCQNPYLMWVRFSRIHCFEQEETG